MARKKKEQLERECMVKIIKGWAAGYCANAIYSTELNKYIICGGPADAMYYPPEYIKEYTIGTIN